jgi:hypothetical protein
VPSTQPQRPYNVRYYWAHRAEEIERVRRRQRATVEWLRDLRRVPCADCGKTYPPYVMDFDHRDPLTKCFSLLADKPLLKNREVLLAEVAKCDVVCANCHAERTWRQWATHDWGWPSGGKSDRIEYDGNEREPRPVFSINYVTRPVTIAASDMPLTSCNSITATRRQRLIWSVR